METQPWKAGCVKVGGRGTAVVTVDHSEEVAVGKVVTGQWTVCRSILHVGLQMA